MEMVTEDLSFTNHDTLYATHGLHSFGAKCPPQVVRWAIENYTIPNDIVLDPMVGSGTTLIEAKLLGRHSYGIDIDPLARLISKVKCTPLPLDQLKIAIKLLLEKFEQDCNSVNVEQLSFPRLTNLDYWFLPEVKIKLALLKREIQNLDVSAEIKDFFYVAFSSLIISKKSIANARDVSHSRHHYLKHESAPDVFGLLRRRLNRMKNMMQDFVSAYACVGYPSVENRIIGTDARTIELPDRSIDLIFTSPPYCNAIDYPRAHKFSIAWLADVLDMTLDDYAELAKKYIGTERGSKEPHKNIECEAVNIALIDEIAADVKAQDSEKGRVVLRYFKDMWVVLKEMVRVLKPNKRLVLVICPSHIRKVEIPSHEVFIEMGKHIESEDGCILECERLIERTMDDGRRLLPFMRETFGERMRTEYVVVFQKVTADSIVVL